MPNPNDADEIQLPKTAPTIAESVPGMLLRTFDPFEPLRPLLAIQRGARATFTGARTATLAARAAHAASQVQLTDAQTAEAVAYAELQQASRAVEDAFTLIDDDAKLEDASGEVAGPQQVRDLMAELHRGPARVRVVNPPAGVPVGGQPTQAMIDRAKSWCLANGVDEAKAVELGEVFSLWAAEYWRRGAFGENVAVAIGPSDPPERGGR